MPVFEAAADDLNAGTWPWEALSAGGTTKEVVCAAYRHRTSSAGLSDINIGDGAVEEQIVT